MTFSVFVAVVLAALAGGASAQLANSDCIRMTGWCFGNMTVKPTAALKGVQGKLCAANVTAYCNDWCPKYAAFKVCMEPLRADCYRYSSPNNLFMNLDRTCNSTSAFCTGCCEADGFKPIIKTPANLTCNERREYCDDLERAQGITAGCQGCTKFSLKVACRSVDPKCTADENWRAVTDVTLRGCAALKGLCGDCCGLDVTVNSTCPGDPPQMFTAPKSTMAGATPAPGAATTASVNSGSLAVTTAPNGSGTSADATGGSNSDTDAAPSSASRPHGCVAVASAVFAAVMMLAININISA